MGQLTDNPGYNERLFNKGIRSQIHLARFAWLRKMVCKVSTDQPLRIIELGCYDGRSIDWLPGEPVFYDGFDANWEGGLEIGKRRFASNPKIHFHQCSNPSEMIPAKEGYDIGISLETVEHIPPEMLDGYLDVFFRSVKTAVFFSVPNEIGIPFLSKYLAKKIIYRDSKDEPYSFSEVCAEIFGQTRKVHRNEHKGFNYHSFVDQLQEKFIIQSISGVPYSWLPASFSFTVGIVARPKRG